MSERPKNSLKVRRAEKDVSQLRVAADTGIPSDRYHRIEKGYVQPSADDIRKLTEYFGVPAAVIFPDMASAPDMTSDTPVAHV